MIFNVMKDWEITNPIIKSLRDPNSRIYPMVEVAINNQLLHVDIKLIDNDDLGPMTHYRRFILARLSDALALIAQEPVKDHRICLQTPKNVQNPTEEYKIIEIREIYEAQDEFGQRAEIFVGANNFRYINSPIAGSEKELKNKKLVYFK